MLRFDNDDLRFRRPSEDFLVETLAAQPGMEAFNVTVFSRTARLDIDRLHRFLLFVMSSFLESGQSTPDASSFPGEREAIPAGAGFDPGVFGFRSDGEETTDGPERVAIDGDRSGITGWEDDGGACVRWNRHVHGQFSRLDFPLADNWAVGGIVGGLHPGEIAHDRRLKYELLKAGRGGIGPDPGQSLVEPTIQGEKAGMDMRVVAVPLFPEGGGSLLGHESPAGIRFLVDDGVDEIVSSDLLQILDEKIGAQTPGIEMTVIFHLDKVHQILQHGIVFRGRHDIGRQGHDLIGLVVVDVLMSVRMIKSSMDERADRLQFFLT
jgi:hypothetical protein